MYKELGDKQVIDLAIDFVKTEQEMPGQLKVRLKQMGLYQVICNPVPLEEYEAD